MLEALQVYCLEQLLSRSARTLRQSESTWDIFANDPVNHRILQSQQVYEVLTDAQAGRIAGLPGDEHPDMLDGLRSLWQPDSPRPHPPPPSATVASVFGITTSGVRYYWSGVSVVCLSCQLSVCDSNSLDKRDNHTHLDIPAPKAVHIKPRRFNR